MQRLDLASATTMSVPARTAVLVPVGSIEQHGPHLPLDTDTVIATAVAGGAAERLREAGHAVTVAPAICYGASGEHQSFAGTSSIGLTALRLVLVELTRSMCGWAEHVAFVNAHGGNLWALRSAVDQLTAEGRAVSWFPCMTEMVDLHAGRAETSLMLQLRPWDVRLDCAEVGDTRSLRELMPLMRAGGVEAVSPNGVLGNPAGASAQEGSSLLDDMVRRVGDAVHRTLNRIEEGP